MEGFGARSAVPEQRRMQIYDVGLSGVDHCVAYVALQQPKSWPNEGSASAICAYFHTVAAH